MAYSKLRRNTSQRKALLRNLVSDLLIHDRIFTTESKAKELSKIIEKVIHLGKKNTLSSRRLASNFLFDKKIDENKTVLQKLFKEIATKYENLQSGYTRIIKSVPRRGDSSFMAIISLV
ncbi:50S ribosomal protein L17 [Candidatus Phytoplasma luffae]|uniref:Large ribosomal subunit protein bL17 n=1 Tax=Loofah witches'-broom phytoplasma TaxID=35773 RepID=A0A975FJ23_LOWBP|nr:50S ribosomal protein L17 [Candidatus Phytoplasma luffae]QTX02804.1 50S ribosomal protein L17 [Candidatus Phytoplasma luffae]